MDSLTASAQRSLQEVEHPRCLIVEDQALIALSIESYLEDIGYETVGPFRSGGEALASLDYHTPQAAIIDYSLTDGTCVELARELLRRRIPFVVYSGHRQRDNVSSEFNSAPWLEKPCSRDDLLSALQSILFQSRS